MERKIGDTFEFEGKKIEVRAASRGCDGCFLKEKCCIDSAELVGICGAGDRTDKKHVVFVEVQEQPQKTEEIKERKVGEVFEYEGHKLKVVADTDGRKCPKCFFYSRDCSLIRDVIGYCLKEKRIDRKGVTFVEVKDEQPQEQAEQPRELNLCEILKDCPKGTKFYSSIFGEETYLFGIDNYEGNPCPIAIYGKLGEVKKFYLSSKGHPFANGCGECVLFPSATQRDWSKFTAPWLKKERFDPKTMKAFDKVIVKLDNGDWHCSILSHREDNNIYYRMIDGYGYSHVIPYNDDTKHIVGTKDEAPLFYRYWED